MKRSLAHLCGRSLQCHGQRLRVWCVAFMDDKIWQHPSSRILHPFSVRPCCLRPLRYNTATWPMMAPIRVTERMDLTKPRMDQQFRSHQAQDIE